MIEENKASGLEVKEPENKKTKKVIKVRKANYEAILSLVLACAAVPVAELLIRFFAWIATVAQLDGFKAFMYNQQELIWAGPIGIIAFFLAIAGMIRAKRRGGYAISIIAMILSIFAIVLGAYMIIQPMFSGF